MTYRLGLIVPSSNLTMETELSELFRGASWWDPERFTFHASRMGMTQVTPEALVAPYIRAPERCSRRDGILQRWPTSSS